MIKLDKQTKDLIKAVLIGNAILIVLSIVYFVSPYKITVLNLDTVKQENAKRMLDESQTLADRIATAQGFCAIRQFSIETGYPTHDGYGKLRTSEQDYECQALDTINVAQGNDGHYHFSKVYP